MTSGSSSCLWGKHLTNWAPTPSCFRVLWKKCSHNLKSPAAPQMKCPWITCRSYERQTESGWQGRSPGLRAWRSPGTTMPPAGLSTTLETERDGSLFSVSQHLSLTFPQGSRERRTASRFLPAQEYLFQKRPACRKIMKKKDKKRILQVATSLSD